MSEMTSAVRPRGATRESVLAALLAALLAASVLVTIPLGAVPLTLQVFVIVLIALICRPVPAAMAVGLYLIMGGIGLPVFSGMQGGLGVLFGPTGGYLLGFFVGAVAGSLAREMAAPLPDVARDALAASVCVALIYLLGWVQLHFVSGMGWGAAFTAGVAPFVLIDVAKALVAVGVARVLRRTGVLPAAE